MSEPLYNVLFLCTGNSTRSIMAEAVLQHLGRGRFRVFSAGSHPAGAVHPLTLETLRRMKLPSTGFRSKSWDEFAAAGAPPLHFVFTVCDKAAGEVCPVWPGQPVTAHWGVEDPGNLQGAEEQRLAAHKRALLILTRRIELFLNLPLEKLDRLALKERLASIGKEDPPLP
jgi:protein-tyrosine-phosphatase